jgi:hypothetical protein
MAAQPPVKRPPPAPGVRFPVLVRMSLVADLLLGLRSLAAQSDSGQGRHGAGPGGRGAACKAAGRGSDSPRRLEEPVA